MKKFSKRLIAAVLGIVMATCITGCSSGSSTSTPAPAASASASSSTSATEAKPDKVYECVAALHTTAGGIEEQTVQKFSDLLKEKTNGGVDVQVFSGASLGTEQENLDQIKTNEVQFVLFGDVFTSQLLQPYNATSIPFVFTSEDAALGYWEGISDTVDQIVKEQGNMYIVGREYRAPRELTSNKVIAHPADLSGLKLRVPETTFYMTVWNGLGANATPVNWSEIYTALQTGVVDAQENPVETYYNAGLQEVQSNTTMSNHIYTFYTWTVNADFYDSLPNEYKTAFDECAAEALKEVNDGLYDRQDEIVEKLKAEGHVFTDIDPVEWQEAAMPYIKECADSLDENAKNAVYAELGI